MHRVTALKKNKNEHRLSPSIINSHAIQTPPPPRVTCFPAPKASEQVIALLLSEGWWSQGRFATTGYLRASQGTLHFHAYSFRMYHLDLRSLPPPGKLFQAIKVTQVTKPAENERPRKCNGRLANHAYLNQHKLKKLGFKVRTCSLR